eukprot:TRINITY_DN83298_c0_g1_i1.p1 TRINITY_DN83298_c0_g1~~TRINITY_DN83298_c0_g1_i1.p1  ORF type:complete len:180 (-),score=35.24 TRINITY_DN83298_c0_g1_i1:212-751(-)
MDQALLEDKRDAFAAGARCKPLVVCALVLAVLASSLVVADFQILPALSLTAAGPRGGVADLVAEARPSSDPSGKWCGDISLLGHQASYSAVLNDGQADIFVAGRSCLGERYSFHPEQHDITLDTVDEGGDCIHKLMQTPFGSGQLDSIAYQSMPAEIKVVGKVHVLFFSVPVKAALYRC